jgi:hypothetical protein
MKEFMCGPGSLKTLLAAKVGRGYACLYASRANKGSGLITPLPATGCGFLIIVLFLSIFMAT